MWLSVRLSRGLRLQVPWWLSWAILPIALCALVLILVVDLVVRLIVAPIRSAAAANGGSERVMTTPVDVIRLNSRRVATTIQNLEDERGYAEDIHFHAAHPQARRWDSPDGQTTLTVRYDAAGRPMDGDWHSPPGD